MSQDLEVEFALSARDWNGTAVAAGAAETLDGGDVTGLGMWGVLRVVLWTGATSHSARTMAQRAGQCSAQKRSSLASM